MSKDDGTRVPAKGIFQQRLTIGVRTEVESLNMGQGLNCLPVCLEEEFVSLPDL
jgi:hypothetical protein